MFVRWLSTQLSIGTVKLYQAPPIALIAADNALCIAKKRDSLKSNRKHRGKTSRKDTPYRMIS